MDQNLSRRGFVTAAAAATGVALSSAKAGAASAEKPALLGGKKVRTAAFPKWPVMDAREDEAMLSTLHSGKWYRGDSPRVVRFEDEFAKRAGAKHCIATASGTTALVASLGALDIGPGDEVIVTPYTFIATLNSILLHYALPVLVDIDPETFLIDPAKIEPAITERTAAIMPVHIGGNVSNMDPILEVAKKRKLHVIEDCCQAHVARWRNRHVGTLGATGCFSFQVTKNLSSGEGGAILTEDGALAERIYAFQNNCRARNTTGLTFFYTPTRAANFRMTEFQGALLSAQMTRLEEQSQTREQNAAYLTKLLADIPGIRPAKMYEGCTRNNYHLYMFRYNEKEFAGLTRDKFLLALAAEGIPCFGGYSPVPWGDFLKTALGSRAGRRVFSEQVLKEWPERCRVPEHERLCRESIWLTQPMLLGPRGDMDQIAEAIRKIKAHAGELARSA